MPTNNDDDDRCVCNGAMTCHTTRKSLSREVFFFVCFAFFSTFLNGSNINHTSLKPITTCHSAVFERYVCLKCALLSAKLILFSLAPSLSPPDFHFPAAMFLHSTHLLDKCVINRSAYFSAHLGRGYLVFTYHYASLKLHICFKFKFGKCFPSFSALCAMFVSFSFSAVNASIPLEAF